MKTQNEVQTLKMSQIVLGTNPRKTMSSDKLTELKASIKESGQIQPVYVAPHPTEKKKFLLIAGFRRYRAMKELKADTILARVTEYDAAKNSIAALAENLLREDVPATEEGKAFLNYLEVEDCTQGDLATKLGVSPTYVSQRIKLYENAGSSLTDALEDGMISATAAQDIADLPEEAQDEVIEEIHAAQEAGEKVRVSDIKEKVEKRRVRAADPDLSDLSDELRNNLSEGTLRTKNELITAAIQLAMKHHNSKSETSKTALKEKIAIIEFALNLRDSVV